MWKNVCNGTICRTLCCFGFVIADMTVSSGKARWPNEIQSCLGTRRCTAVDVDDVRTSCQYTIARQGPSRCEMEVRIYRSRWWRRLLGMITRTLIYSSEPFDRHHSFAFHHFTRTSIIHTTNRNPHLINYRGIDGTLSYLLGSVCRCQEGSRDSTGSKVGMHYYHT